MEDASGIELSLLEGMDETLLVRLHGAGIRTREALGARIGTPEGRRKLAHELRTTPRRLQILHYLNFLLPEARVEHVFELEHRLKEQDERLQRDLGQIRRVGIGVSIAIVGLLLVLVIVFRPSGFRADSDLGRRVEGLEGEVAALRPLGVARAEESVVRALARLGPAPDWNGPLRWTAEEDRTLDRLLGADASHDPPRGLSLALRHLAAIESAAPDSLTPLDRARQASALLADLPPVTTVETLWDAGAVLVRSRIRSRAFGLDPRRDLTPSVGAALPWSWTSPAFLTCEEILTRLEALPVAPDACADWSGALLELRGAADRGRDGFAGRPEAFARDYWIRRGELELATTAALAGRHDLVPYSGASPRGFLVERREFLLRSLENAPSTARPPLAWLGVEYDEALTLLDWLDAHPRAPASKEGGDGWVETLAAIEIERGSPAAAIDPRVTAGVARALAIAGESGDPWSSPATLRESALRPLLMEVRAAARGR